MAKSTKTPRRVTSPPLPEVLEPKKNWVIREPGFLSRHTGLDYRSGTITVPLDTSPESRVTRNLEMLRLKFSPKAAPRLPEGVDPDVYAMCENQRLRSRGRWLNINQDVRMHSDEELDKTASLLHDKDQQHVLASALVDMAGTSDSGPLFQRIRDIVLNSEDGPARDTLYGRYRDLNYTVDRATRLLTRRTAGPKAAIKAAHIITSTFKPKPPAPPEAGGKEDGSGPDAAEIAKKVEEGTKTLARSSRVREAVENMEYKHGSKPGIAEIHAPEWGEMEIIHPERPLIFPARMRSKRWKPTDAGAVFRYPQRWLADQSGFAYRGIKQGGVTMLIDVSGSMSLTPEDILQVMTHMPASLIATYSGRDTTGTLAIVAEKGRRVEKHNLRLGGGGNVVDGPALRWLAKQKGPRYWISDGGVTGKYDSGMSSTQLLAECIFICRRAHIMRINSMAEVLAEFDAYGRRHRT